MPVTAPPLVERARLRVRRPEPGDAEAIVTRDAADEAPRLVVFPNLVPAAPVACPMYRRALPAAG